MKAPVEAKVTAGAAGAGGGGALGAALAVFIVYLLGATVYQGATEPPAVSDLVMIVVPLATGAAGSYIAGWLAPHTTRPDLQAQVPTPRPGTIGR